MSALAAMAFLLAGCPESAPPPSAPDAVPRAELYLENNGGPVFLVFTDHDPTLPGPPDGVRRALFETARRLPGASAAAFRHDRVDDARLWVDREAAKRRERGVVARLVVGGHGLGGTEAAEFVRRYLQRRDGTVDLLVTVDAVRPGLTGQAAGLAAKALSPIPQGGKLNFTPYDAAPEPDGRRFRRHHNYYQTETRGYQGGPMPRASLNHVVTGPPGAINHGNVDDYGYPMLKADLARLFFPGEAMP